MQYTHEVQNMCCVAKGPNHGPAPIPEEGKWVQARQTEDEQAHGNEADRQGDEQSFAHFLLIDVEKVGQDEAART